MRPRALIATAAAVATLAAAPAAQAVDQPTLDRINDSMVATYGIRLPVRYVQMPAGRVAQLNWVGDYVVELDPDYAPDDVFQTCQTVAHEYTHWTRRDQEAEWVAALPAGSSPADIVLAQHRQWPQDESQPYPPCRDIYAGEQWRRQMEDRAQRLNDWLVFAPPLSWKNCRTRRTAKARRACVRQVDAKWRHRRQVRRELARINRLLG